MDFDESVIFQTAMDVVARYGMKRATMAELARGAGVSRQTLYDRYGDKDGVMAATIEHWAEQRTIELNAAIQAETGLAEQIDAYFNIVVWPTYDALQRMPDAADFEKGMGPRSSAMSSAVSKQKQDILTEMFRPHLSGGKPDPRDVATFFEQSTARAKMSDTKRDALVRFLAVLKASTLALARG